MKKILILSALMTALASAGAMAADANINFTGTVSAATCTLAAADAAQTLTIPNVSPATLLATPNSQLSYNASGSFNFSACPAGLTRVTSAYTYQGTSHNNNTWSLATGTAQNVSFYVMQSVPASTVAGVKADGTSAAVNQTTITANAATVPVTVGIAAYNGSSVLTLPTVGTYTGTFQVAFTYS